MFSITRDLSGKHNLAGAELPEVAEEDLLANQPCSFRLAMDIHFRSMWRFHYCHSGQSTNLSFLLGWWHCWCWYACVFSFHLSLSSRPRERSGHVRRATMTACGFMVRLFIVLPGFFSQTYEPLTQPSNCISLASVWPFRASEGRAYRSGSILGMTATCFHLIVPGATALNQT